MVYYCFTHIISIPLLLAEETILVRVSALGATGKATRNLGEVEEEEDGTNKRSLKSSLFMWCQHGGLDQEL